MKKISDLKLKSKSELWKLDSKKLTEELNSAKSQLFNLKMKLQLDELKETHLVKILRRYIALIKTISNRPTTEQK